MAEYTFATLDRWALKTEARITAITKQALNDTLLSIEIVPGVSRGGNPQLGSIPRDTGALAQSLVSEVHGGAKHKGDKSHVLAIANLRAGQDMSFSWTVSYAAAVHYGTGRRRGLHWVTVAAKRWQQHVTNATQRLRF